MSKNPTIRTLRGDEITPTWKEIFEAAARVEKFFEALSARFVERDDLIRKIKYAFLMREHVLVNGPTGAAKSKLIDTIFSRIQGAELWSMDLTQFTNDTHLFGNYDMSEMQKTGKLVHLTEGSIARANFAKTGEFFDASNATLRTLLGVLNERVVKRGPQVMHIPLISAIADTNFEPNDMPQRSKALEAVVDRFLFRTHIDYVRDPANRYRMLETALENDYVSGVPELAFADIELISAVVSQTNMVHDSYVKEAYVEMTDAFSKGRVSQGRSPLSDRRFVRSAHLMEVCAILNGRTETTFDDIKISRHVLCQGPDDEALLATCREASVEKWSKKSMRRVVDLEAAALAAMVKKAPPLTTGMTVAALKQAASELAAISRRLAEQKVDSIEAQTAQAQYIGRAAEQIAWCQQTIVASLVENLPTVVPGTAVTADQVGVMLQRLARLHEEARELRPVNDAVAKQQIDLLQAIYKTKADLELELTK